MPAPIALFVYNRPWHTEQTVNALIKNKLADQSDLIIFSDGAKNKNQYVSVEKVRKFITEIKGFKSIKIVESKINKGLANSIIDGVSSILDNNETIIVLEDDMVTSPYFLTYMNDALQLYKNDEEVISIHGYIYPIKEKLPETFFLKGADCWGWATWKRGWNLFEKNGKKLLNEIQKRKLEKEFDFHGSYPYTKMLKDQINGSNDSWAIRWYASAFLRNMLTLYPGTSLLNNIGNDKSGTHSWDQARFDTPINTKGIKLQKILLEEHKAAKQLISNYFRTGTPSFYRKVINKLTKYIFSFSR